MDLWHKIAETTTLADKVLYKSAVNGILLQQILQVATAIKTEDALPSLAERLRALHICRKARIFVEDSLAVDIVPTIVDICASVGASERTLQYAFRSYVNLSPLAYLRFCRLNRVRARLLAADPKITTVTSVAMSFGFLHLGRFSSDYKKAFDELPSETLAT